MKAQYRLFGVALAYCASVAAYYRASVDTVTGLPLFIGAMDNPS